IGSIIEYRNSTIFNSDRSHSFIFNDYEGEDVKSTRIYEDVFPNELSEKYNLDNYQKTIYNDNNDEDPSNDLVLQAPALESLLNFTHTTDAVPAIFDRRILINCPAVIDNILETPVSISIPDSKTDLDRSTATLDVIEVIPDNGKVIIDSNPRKGPSEVSVSGGRYLHYSSAQDGNYDQVFVIDENGDVLAIAIDYDYNFLVEPNKKMLTEKHILATNIVEGDVGYLMSDSRVYLKDNKKHDGIFLDPTFTDSLYDIWKTVYISSSSQLMSEVKAITSRQFVQSVQGRIVEDIAFQVVSQLIAFAASQVLHAIPVVGSVLAVVGYALIYGLISAWKAHQDAIENARDIASFTLKNPSYDSPITLSSKDAYSDLWGGTLPNIVGFSTGGVYTDTLLETDEHLFKGKLVLAPKGVKKTGPLGLRNIPISLDYTIQKGGYTMYSDFDDPRLSPYFKAPLKPIYNPLTSSVKTYAGQLIEYNEKVEKLDPELRYMTNSIMFLERSISEQTNGQYDTIYPYMTYGQGTFIPTFQFGGLGAKFPVPEFYREYPTFVDSEYYSDVKNEYSNIYKVFDMDSSQTIELIPENSIHAIYGDVPQIEAILVDTEGNEVKLSPFKSSDDMFTFTAELGTIHISNFMYNTLQEQMTQHKKQYASVQDYDAYYILKIGVARYRSTDDLGDMTQEEVDHIATMQSIDQTLLEYSYQFIHAQNTQKGLSEMFYTTIVTVVSTIITTIATLGVGAYASKVYSKAMNKAAATIAKETGKKVGEVTLKEAAKTLSFAQRITQSFAGSTSSAGLISVMLSPIKETLQEIFVDPYLETIVTDITAKWGWSVFGQVLASSMASATRETLTGSMTQFIFGGGDQQGLFVEQHKTVIGAQQNGIETNIKSKKYSLKYSPSLSTFIKTGASLLIGAALGAMGGPMFFGATVGMGLASVISIAEDLDVVKTITHEIVEKTVHLRYLAMPPGKDREIVNIFANQKVGDLLPKISGFNINPKLNYIFVQNAMEVDPSLSISDILSSKKRSLWVMLAQSASGAKKFNYRALGTFDSWQEGLDKYLDLKKFSSIDNKIVSKIYSTATKIISKAKMEIEVNRAELGYDPKIDKISKFKVNLENLEDARLFSLLSWEGKQKFQWWGFIYEWKDSLTGLTMTGKTRIPHPIRKSQYIWRAVRGKTLKYAKPHAFLSFSALKNLNKQQFNDIVSEGITIRGLIRQHLDSLGLILYKANGKVDYRNLDWNIINTEIDKRFEFKLKNLYFSESALSKAEIGRVYLQRNKGVGLNVDDKSAGKWSPNYLIGHIIRASSMGLNLYQIHTSLKAMGYKSNLKVFREIVNKNLGGIKKLREKYYFPILRTLREEGLSKFQVAEAFTEEIIRPFLPEIDYYFRQGYDAKTIAFKSGLSKVTSSSEAHVISSIYSLYPDIYVNGMSFEDLRVEIFKGIFLDHIRAGVKDYETMRTRIIGFDRPIYGNNIKKRNDYVASFFRKVFNQGISNVAEAVFPSPSNIDLYNQALALIKQNSGNTRYSAAQLAIDLKLSNLFGISEKTLRAQGSYYIQMYIGVSFKDIKFQALNIPLRNYFDLAITLLRANIKNIGYNRYKYNMGKLTVGLNLNLDFGYPVESLKANANRFLKVHTGYNWDDLIRFAKSNLII
ncbi:hypothetical protein LCGC14_1145590, partial [marine sediment metagenome]